VRSSPVGSGPSWGSVASRALPLVASLVLTLAFGELIFRTAFPQPLYAVTYAPWGFWHIPGTCLDHAPEPWHEGEIFVGHEFRTRVCYNSLGLRERELPLAKPPGTLRVVVLGDSYGEGMEVAFDQTVGQVLERALDDRMRELGPTRPSVAAPGPAPVPRGSDPDRWVATRAILHELQRHTAADGIPLLVANVQYRGADLALRASDLDTAGIPWVDLSLQDPAQAAIYHYRYDTHWNAAGHARAAGVIANAILARHLLGGGPARVEVVNGAMSAFSTCKELQVYDAIARRYAPDLVVVVYTGNDERNLADADMCRVGADGTLTVVPRTFSPLEMAVREVRGLLRSHSHLYAWLADRIALTPLFAPRDAIPLTDPDAAPR
jgi:hypothetical protein